MAPKEKKAMGNLKKFFKSITKPTGSSSSSSSSSSGAGGGGSSALSPRAVLPTGDNQFSIAHENTLMMSSFKGTLGQRSPPKPTAFGMSIVTNGADGGGGIGDPSITSPQRPSADSTSVRWGLVLSRIPKLVAEATSTSAATSSNGSGTGSPTANPAFNGGGKRGSDDSGADFVALLELLRQMATREYQAQIMQYYMGSQHATASGVGTASNSAPSMANIHMLSNWEQRKVFKQCRRSLLLCWKFIISQLNDEKVQKTMGNDTRDTYYQLVGFIAERVEFNLLPESKDVVGGGSGMGGGRGGMTKGRSASQSGSSYSSQGALLSPSSSIAIQGFDVGAQGHEGGGAHHGSSNQNGDEGGEGERDIYLYRCLLVATFKHVIESIDAANQKKRPFISWSESQFFAKVLAICFFRIPVVQRMIIDSVYEAYRGKRWVKTQAGSTSINNAGPSTPSHASNQQHHAANSRMNRRRSSSKPWNGMTFVGTLSRWSEFEGQTLSEPGDNGDGSKDAGDGGDKSSEASAADSAAKDGNPYAPPSRAVLDKFRRLNPTLFRWGRYNPYLGPYADADVFRMHESAQASWLARLTQDGEFYACFMAAYTQHAEFVSIGEPVWPALPGYALLTRVAMLLVKEAAWQKWQSIRDATENVFTLNPMGNQREDGAAPAPPPAFELKPIRGSKSVLDSVVHLLRNRDVLESVVLAMLECTNVLNVKSVGVCLSRLEEWFGVAAVMIPSALHSSGEMDVTYRLPPSFHGHALATAVRIMFCSESFEILNRVMLFLYNRIDYFDGELRQGVLKAVVQRHMFLFLHWNADVRRHYHHFLVYKVVRVNRYLLDSPIDQLLIGRFAMLPLDVNAHRGDSTSGIGFDDSDGPFDDTGPRPVLTAAEFNMLRLEQALWRAFDACLAAICVQERRHAREGNRKYQIELQAARCRAIAFQNLNPAAVQDDEINMNPLNEGLPGGKPSHEVDLLQDELHREPPYYLRYLPAEEVSSLDELRRLAMTVKYPAELQIYAALSLRQYSDLLKQYFTELRENGIVEAPPLGFC